jgi:hypothetical protein
MIVLLKYYELFPDLFHEMTLYICNIWSCGPIVYREREYDKCTRNKMRPGSVSQRIILMDSDNFRRTRQAV